MIKQKLIDKRKERNLTQEEFAFRLGIETSNYSRRESGITKISKKEWDKMAKLLDTTLDEIYEPEDGIYVINGDNATGNFGNGGTFNNFNEFAFETMKKYIQKLEDENAFQKQEVANLKAEIAIKKSK
jgi:transcriptional regulator with XRE-family HTH domain